MPISTTFISDGIKKVQSGDKNLPIMGFKQLIPLSFLWMHSSTAWGRVLGNNFLYPYISKYIYMGWNRWQWQKLLDIWLLINRIKFLILLAVLYINPIKPCGGKALKRKTLYLFYKKGDRKQQGGLLLLIFLPTPAKWSNNLLPSASHL